MGNVLSADERAKCEHATQNYPLTPLGREQARLTGEYIRKMYPTPDVRYVSYYERSRETMELIYPGARVYEDPRLAEAQRGIWHTLTSAEIREHYFGEHERKEKEGLYHYRPPGGENWPDVELRTHSVLGTLSRDCGGKTVVMVVHGHWLILFERLVLRFSIDEALRRYQAAVVPNASVTVYGEIEGGRLGLISAECAVPWKGKI